MKIVICEDEKNIRTYIHSLIEKQDMECEITEYGSADEYLSCGMEHNLLFLDIEMNDSSSGMDGMKMAKRVRHHSSRQIGESGSSNRKER